MTVISCRWDWCRSSFPTIDALDTHVKHEHIWPMKPLRKAEIALMRRMDLQSLHSSLDTQSGIFSTACASPSKITPPASVTPTPPKPGNDEFETFTQLSSPLQNHSPRPFPVSPAFEGLVGHNGVPRLSAAVEMFERTHAHRTQPTKHPSSGSSQEIIELQLTQEDDFDFQSLEDTELRWPDEEPNAPTPKDVQDSKQLASKHSSGSPADSTRGQHFRHGSLNVALGIKDYSQKSCEASHDSGGSQSQPLILQSQPYYSSQALGQTP